MRTTRIQFMVALINFLVVIDTGTRQFSYPELLTLTIDNCGLRPI